MDVKPQTIRNCFRHCLILTTDADVTPVLEEPLIDPEVIKDFKEQQFWMQQDIVDHEMLANIQTIKDKISIMRSSKLVQKPISEYFSKV
ncbi:unnamed protein product [Sphagnum troendelagicum]|uniref:Uncharacterized protein n=1 Tax=Sphagnum troendelagicum TaxID=128251 RepID=A0ABP0T8B5_9BRYO